MTVRIRIRENIFLFLCMMLFLVPLSFSCFFWHFFYYWNSLFVIWCRKERERETKTAAVTQIHRLSSLSSFWHLFTFGLTVIFIEIHVLCVSASWQLLKILLQTHVYFNNTQNNSELQFFVQCRRLVLMFNFNVKRFICSWQFLSSKIWNKFR